MMYLGSGDVSRHEKIKVHLELDKRRTSKHARDIRNLTGLDPGKVADGDIVKVAYTCNVYYLGETAEKFEALIRLLDDPEMIVEAKLEEFRYGECLIAELAQKIQQVQEMLKRRGIS